MEDEKLGLDAHNNTQSTGGESADKVDLSTLPESVQTYIKALRGEAAEKRKKLEALEAQMNEAQQRQLAEQGKWKELAEAREAELNKLKPYQARAQLLETKLSETNKERLKKIPEHFHSLIPPLPPEELATWLDANEAKLITPPAPNLDAGAGGKSGGVSAANLSAEELAMAKKMGISPEDFAKYKL